MSVITKHPILVVDDFGPMRRIYLQFFKQMGLRDIDVASDGVQALAMLLNRAYAAILSDWHMETMNGLQLLRTIRADRSLRTIPFIMATVEARPDRIRAAQLAGASDYILKPFNVAGLRSAVANASPALAAAMEPPMLAPSADDSAERWRRLTTAHPMPMPAAASLGNDADFGRHSDTPAPD